MANETGEPLKEFEHCAPMRRYLDAADLAAAGDSFNVDELELVEIINR